MQINRDELYKEKSLKFYEYIEIYSDIIERCYNELKKNKLIIKNNFKDQSDHLKKFNLKFNINIEDELDYILLIVSSFILKSFTDTKITNYDDMNTSFNLYESDSIINTILYDYESFKI
jgi:hypothetical protein